MSSFWRITVFIIVGGIVAFLGYSYFPQFSAFFSAMLMVGVGVGLFALVDKYLLPEFDTIKQLENNNVAVALMLVALAILIHAAITAAF